MPRGGPGPSSRRHDEEEEEMDYTMSQATQQTQSLTQAQRAADSLPKEVIDQKVSNLVQYMLIMEAKKNPVKRSDLYKNVFKEHKNILPEVLRRAKVKLNEIFGYELVEAEQGGKTKTKCYFLLNSLSSDLTQDLVRNNDEVKFGLLYIILALIFMNEGQMSDVQMWLLLQKLELNPEEKHPVYGDVRKLVTQDFTKQLYLDCQKIPNTDPVESEFKWGLRAEKEMDKEQILNLVAQIMGEQNPSIWKTQYREVLIAKGINPDEAAENGEDNEEDDEDMDDD
ncbi:non-structural maintenance of chromosomes element 3 homolog [Lytechinus pictus]|uniref:non-structural maintenance of chromosomes element 3 homolog n=1 Tax=Lytechinus pictus TaxID=7653 RepID=UPI0030BA2625